MRIIETNNVINIATINFNNQSGLTWLITAKKLMIRTVLSSSRRLGRAAERLIDGMEKRICGLSCEFWSPHVIERRSK